MPGRREVLTLGGVAIAAAAAGVWLGPGLLQPQGGAAQLFATTYPDQDGQPRRLLEWQGRVLVCNFWATWCEPCREEIPMLVRMREKYVANGVEFVGISIDQVAKVRHFAISYKVSYPLLIADASALDLMRHLGNQAGALPFTVVLNRQGAVAYRKLGLLKAQDLEPVVAGLIG
jgi:thiol-disulfide isomerase/thioredoxin